MLLSLLVGRFRKQNIRDQHSASELKETRFSWIFAESRKLIAYNIGNRSPSAIAATKGEGRKTKAGAVKGAYFLRPW